MMTILISLFVVAWVAAALIGSESFDFLAKSFTGKETDYMERVPAYVVVDASKRIEKY